MLAEKDSRIQLHPSTISAWERGLTSHPTARTVSWVAKAFNDFTPFSLTGHMLLHDDLEKKFHEAEQIKQNVHEKISSIEKTVDDLKKHLKHCIYRIQTLEEDRNRFFSLAQTALPPNAPPDPQLSPILHTFGLYEKEGRFFTRDDTEVTDSVAYLHSIIASKNTP